MLVLIVQATLLEPHGSQNMQHAPVISVARDNTGCRHVMLRKDFFSGVLQVRVFNAFRDTSNTLTAHGRGQPTYTATILQLKLDSQIRYKSRSWRLLATTSLFKL